MPDYTDPSHYADAATAAEQLMRADFANVTILRNLVPYVDTLTESEQLLALATEIEKRWTLRDGSPFSEWAYLAAAAAAHQGPQQRAAGQALASLCAVDPPGVDEDPVLPIHRRSRRQAAELVAWIDQLSGSA